MGEICINKGETISNCFAKGQSSEIAFIGNHRTLGTIWNSCCMSGGNYGIMNNGCQNNISFPKIFCNYSF